jgi:zinc protease
MKEGVENRQRNPQAVFGDAIEKALYGDHYRHRPMSMALLKELDRDTALRVYRERFANAGDFTFTFVGAFQLSELRPLVETYLASLPAMDRPEKGRDIGDDPKGGRINVEVQKGLEPKCSVRITFHGDAKWNMDERFVLRATVDILRIRLRELLREDKGGVYGVSVWGDLDKLPKETFSCGVAFTCSPDNVTDLIQSSLEEIKRLQTDGPAKENLEKVRESFLRNFEKGLKEDGFWLSYLTFYREYDEPFIGILKTPERAHALTTKRVQDAAKKYFASDNVMIARLLPEVVKEASADKKSEEPKSNK